MAVAALLLWMCTAAVGSYLLATSIRATNVAPAPPESVSVPAPTAARAPASPASPASPHRPRSEPPPYLRALAEFAHPALALTGLGFWLGYVISRDWLFAAIGLGILLGAIGAGLSWNIVNARAARRAADAVSAADPGAKPLSVSPRLLTLHAIGAVVTLLFTALIAARV